MHATVSKARARPTRPVYAPSSWRSSDPARPIRALANGVIREMNINRQAPDIRGRPALLAIANYAEDGDEDETPATTSSSTTTSTTTTTTTTTTTSTTPRPAVTQNYDYRDPRAYEGGSGAQYNGYQSKNDYPPMSAHSVHKWQSLGTREGVKETRSNMQQYNKNGKIHYQSISQAVSNTESSVHITQSAQTVSIINQYTNFVDNQSSGLTICYKIKSGTYNSERVATSNHWTFEQKTAEPFGPSRPSSSVGLTNQQRASHAN
ncbi:hypothetical protein WN48_04970 [Eufriesea mexicana]|nr:hypothetical protein WN48_04970 [Eufriesea mexicana]